MPCYAVLCWAMLFAVPLEVLQPQSWGNVHALQFLEQQLAGVGELNTAHFLATTARLTVVLIAQQTAALAHIRLEAVTRNHEALHNQVRSAISDETVSLHLS